MVAHFAFSTKEQAQILGWEDFVRRNSEITRTVIEIAKSNDLGGVFLLSSGAVHSCDGTLPRSIESNLYGYLKLEEEQEFVRQLGGRVPVAIIRLFNLSGPYINKERHYVLGSILLDLLGGNRVELLASRPVIRSFVHVADVLNVGMAGALGLISGLDEAIDTAGEVTLEIQELALTAIEQIRPGTLIERPVIDTKLSPDIYVGNGIRFRDSLTELGRVPLSLESQIKDTYNYLRKISF